MLLVATLTFALIHIAPGDPFAALGEGAAVPAEVRQQYRQSFGLDRPLATQYVRYMRNLLRGDLGYSFAEHRPVAQAIAARIPHTLTLAAAGLVIAFGLGIPLGVLQGARPGSRRDRLLSIATLSLYALPVFWLGLMLQLVFAEHLGWLPVGGALDPVTYAHLSAPARLADRLVHLVLPACTLGVVGAAAVAPYQRAAMLEAAVQEFVRAARAKGLSERAVLWRHALRNALLPTATLFGLAFPVLLSGSVLVETVFSWPGMGLLAVRSIATRDYYVVTGIAILAAAMVVVGNLLADLLYWWIDPRTREQR